MVEHQHAAEASWQVLRTPGAGVELVALQPIGAYRVAIPLLLGDEHLKREAHLYLDREATTRLHNELGRCLREWHHLGVRTPKRGQR